jgi:HSP20 family protein
MTYLRTQLAPWRGFHELEDRLNRIFTGEVTNRGETPGMWMPEVDLREGEDAWTLEADLPGMKKEDIALTIDKDVITLKGERKHEEVEEQKGYRRTERRHGHFERAFRIPEGVDADKVIAAFRDGVLKVTLPKPETAKPKQIEVKVS